MVKYFCHNCNDLSLKTITAVGNHVGSKHGLVLERSLKLVLRSGHRVVRFECEECSVFLTNVNDLLNHLDKVHGIHIWYEKGMTRKRVYFDGILEERTEQRFLPTLKKNIPISKRPYEPRKSNST